MTAPIVLADQADQAAFSSLPELTEREARALTEDIKGRVSDLLPRIREAYYRRADRALGYGTWHMYCVHELGGLQLPVSERPAAVAELREAGMSTRAISSALGIGKGTVARELAGAPVGAPDVVGLDGKSYAAAQPARPADEVSSADAIDDVPLWDEPAAVIEPEAVHTVDTPADEQPGFKRQWNDDENALHAALVAGQTIVVSFRANHKNLADWAMAAGLLERIDRRSDWGNPFEMPADGDRDTVIRSYAEHYLPHKPSLLNRIGELKGKALACWCAPEPCHGDVLKARADQC